MCGETGNQNVGAAGEKEQSEGPGQSVKSWRGEGKERCGRVWGTEAQQDTLYERSTEVGKAQCCIFSWKLGERRTGKDDKRVQLFRFVLFSSTRELILERGEKGGLLLPILIAGFKVIRPSQSSSNSKGSPKPQSLWAAQQKNGGSQELCVVSALASPQPHLLMLSTQ